MFKSICRSVIATLLIVSITFSVRAEYVEVSNMISERDNFYAFAYDNYIYCIGGASGVDTTTGVYTVDRYDPIIDQWEIYDTVDFVCFSGYYALIEDNIFVTGGLEDSGWNLDRVYRYNIPSKTTDTLTGYGGLIHSGKAINDNNKFRLLGGHAYNPILDINLMFDPITDLWSTENSLPGVLERHSIAQIHNNIHILGGRGLGGDASNIHIQYDTVLNTFDFLQTLLIGVKDAGAVSYDDKLYVFGGRTSNPVTVNDVQIYDAITDEWSFGESLPYELATCSAVRFNNSIYILGGEDVNGIPTNNVYKLEIESSNINLALNAETYAPTFHNDGKNPSHAVDGDYLTFWSSGAPVPVWWTVDLGNAYEIENIKIVIRGESNPLCYGNPCYDFNILASEDSVNWDLVVFEELTTMPYYTYLLNGNIYRYFKVEYTFSNDWASWANIVEFEVYGSEIVSAVKDTILVLETVPLGVEYIQEMLSGLNVELIVNPSSYDINDYKVVIVSGNAWGSTMISPMRDYLQNGGNVVLGSGAPFYLAGSTTNLSNIQDMLGVSRYGNTIRGHIVLSEDHPFGLPYHKNDTLGYLDAGSPSMANVYSPVDSLLYKTYWEDGTLADGTLYAFAYEPYNGKLFYSSVSAMMDSTNELFAAAVNWMLTDQDVINSNALILPDSFSTISLHSINEQYVDIYIGDFENDYLPEDVDQNSIKVNNNIIPNNFEIIESFPQFDDSVNKMSILLSDFLVEYGWVWGTTIQQIDITGNFTDGTLFKSNCDFILIGHRIGDLNEDGELNISDLTVMINILFVGEDMLEAESLLDLNGSCNFDISDLTYFINYLFGGGEAPKVGCY